MDSSLEHGDLNHNDVHLPEGTSHELCYKSRMLQAEIITFFFSLEMIESHLNYHELAIDLEELKFNNP